MTLYMPFDFVYLRGCSSHNRFLHAWHILMSFRQKSPNVPTRYTISVYCVWTKRKIGKAEKIYAFMLAESDSIIFLNFCNCCFSWFTYSQSASNCSRTSSIAEGSLVSFSMKGEIRNSNELKYILKTSLQWYKSSCSLDRQKPVARSVCNWGKIKIRGKYWSSQKPQCDTGLL